MRMGSGFQSVNKPVLLEFVLQQARSLSRIMVHVLWCSKKYTGGALDNVYSFKNGLL